MIAPVQAFILKQLLLESDVVTWKAIKAEKCDQLLIKAMIEIINQAADVTDPKYSVVHVNNSNVFASCKEVSDPKPVECIENSAEDTGEASQNSRTQVTEQVSLESEVFHSQLRYISAITYPLINDINVLFD